MTLRSLAWPSLRPEDALLLCCARTRLNSGQAERVRALLREEIDWFYLLETALQHEVGSLLYWQLQRTCPEGVPQDCKDFLRVLFEDRGRRILYLTGQLFEILETFEASGILAVPYKGPVLASLAYGNLALRDFIDLDLVVRPEDIPKAAELLIGQGYRPGFRLAWAQAASSSKVPGQYLFTRDADSCVVELHTPLTLRYYPAPLDLDRLARRLQPVSLGRRTIRTFSPEDSLTILSVHNAKHFWERLKWICDLVELVQIPQGINWELAWEEASRLGCERMLFLGLYLANDLLEAPLPEDVLHRVRASRAVESLAAQVRERLFRQSPARRGVLQRLFFRFRMREGLRDGLRYCLRLATSPTETEWGLLRLPAPLEPLYSVLRPFRLVWEHGWGLMGRPAPDLAPFVPTPPAVVERMLTLGEVGPSDVLYDLGCGDGRIVVIAAKRFGARAVGVDIDSRRIRQAKANARRHRVQHRVRFVQQDAKTVDLSEATVVTMYLSLPGNFKLRQRLLGRLQPGARIVSRDFEMPGWLPEKSERVEMPGGRSTTLYMWRVGAVLDRPAADRQLSIPVSLRQ